MGVPWVDVSKIVAKIPHDDHYLHRETYWTEDNLLKKVVRPQGVVVDYLYDAGGDRIYRTGPTNDTFYLFNGLDVSYEEEQGTQGTTKRYYIHALGRHVAKVEKKCNRAQKKYYFHTDYLGSVRMISDKHAEIVWQKRYKPFGGEEEQCGSVENTYQFTGKGYDKDADLYYFNARWYDKDVGRFISEDPLWGNIRDPQTLNRFAYGRNNPFKYVDKDGKEMVPSPVEIETLIRVGPTAAKVALNTLLIIRVAQFTYYSYQWNEWANAELERLRASLPDPDKFENPETLDDWDGGFLSLDDCYLGCDPHINGLQDTYDYDTSNGNSNDLPIVYGDGSDRDKDNNDSNGGGGPYSGPGGNPSGDEVLVDGSMDN